jgi:hypothetical protein
MHHIDEVLRESCFLWRVRWGWIIIRRGLVPLCEIGFVNKVGTSTRLAKEVGVRKRKGRKYKEGGCQRVRRLADGCTRSAPSMMLLNIGTGILSFASNFTSVETGQS